MLTILGWLMLGVAASGFVMNFLIDDSFVVVIIVGVMGGLSLLSLSARRRQTKQAAAAGAQPSAIAQPSNPELNPYAVEEDPYFPSHPQPTGRRSAARVLVVVLGSILAFLVGLSSLFWAYKDTLERRYGSLVEILTEGTPTSEPSELATIPSPEVPDVADVGQPEETPSSTSEEPSPVELDNFAADDLQVILDEFVEMAGNDEVAEITIHDHLVDAVISLEPGSEKFDEYQYLNAQFEHTGAALIQPRLDSQKVFAMGDFDPAVIEAILDRLYDDAGYSPDEVKDEPYFIVDHTTWGSHPDQPTIRAYVGDEYSSKMVHYSFTDELLSVA